MPLHDNKVYITPNPNSAGFSNASTQTLHDVLKFSSEIGFKTVSLGVRAKIPINPMGYFEKIVKYWKNADIILCTYPYICRPTKDNPIRQLESNLIKNNNRNKLSILYIIDLPIEQAISSGKKVDKKAYHIEETILKSFTYLLVFNEKMKENIQEKYGFDDNKFIFFEILDYWVDYKPPDKKKFDLPISIVYSGALRPQQSKWITQLPTTKDIIYEFSGANGEHICKLNKEHIVYQGVIQHNKFFEFLSKHHFGIIHRDFEEINYYEFTSTSKLSAYLIAGLPILCSSEFSYISHLLKKYEVGLSFDTYNDIPKIISNLDELKYYKLRKNCERLSEKIKNGWFFKTAVKKALETKGAK